MVILGRELTRDAIGQVSELRPIGLFFRAIVAVSGNNLRIETEAWMNIAS